MPRLLSTSEIIEMRTQFHPDVHDDSCDVCAVFSTLAAMVLLLDIRAEFDPDEPRDDDGKWSGSGGGGSSSDIYVSPIVPLSETNSDGGIDEKVALTVEPIAIKQAAITDPSILVHVSGNPKDLSKLTTTTGTILNDNRSAVAAKIMVSNDIATRMGSKYDDQLLGTQMTVDKNDNIIRPLTTSLLTKDDVWVTVAGSDGSQPNYNYAGKLGDDAYTDGQITTGQARLGDDPTLRSDLREDAVSQLVSTWAQTSNDHAVQSLAMQESAVKEFGLTGTNEWDDKVTGNGLSYDFIDNNGEHHTLADQVQSEVDKNGEMYQAFLRAQYDNTQQFFKDNDITSVTAYRGFDFNGNHEMPHWADPEYNDIEENEEEEENGIPPHWDADVPLRPLSSFSYDPDTAQNFAGMPGASISIVIGGQVPVSRVLSTAVTGLGCLGEREMVLLGGTDKWTVR